MNAATVSISIALLLGSPAIARELRRITVSIWTEISAIKAELAALKSAAAPDLEALSNKADVLVSQVNTRLDALEAAVGTQPPETFDAAAA